MNTDSYFEIGHTHRICQDYAFSGHHPNDVYSYAVISDGCSASGKHEPVDVGARLITHSYIGQIMFHQSNLFFSNPSTSEMPHFDAETYFKSVLSATAELSLSHCQHGRLGIGHCALDCTLLSIISDGNKVYYSIFGDGAVVFGTESHIYIIDVEFPSGAPFYLSYTRNGDRQDRYVEEFGTQKIVTQTVLDIENRCITNDLQTEINYNDVTAGIFSPDSGKIVFAAAVSDGYKTYFDNSSRTQVDEYEAILDMFSYKNFNGEFVKRRMLSNKKKCDKNNIVHQDDISVAAIHFEDNSDQD